MKEYPIVPGRGLVTPAATQLRLQFLTERGYETEEITRTGLSHYEVRNKIESYIGSVEIPLGLVGPLLIQFKNKKEFVYTAVATLEGALAASMNRGAKAASLSGGISTEFVHQKMSRCPTFIFEKKDQTEEFLQWLNQNFNKIKKIAEQHSNHAKLISIEPVIAENLVHTRFYYSTGDAAGQNMTTTCTWHAMLWIIKTFEADTKISIQHYIIEGNGSSDKKVSNHSATVGRGIHVTATCLLREEVIEKILRTTSEDLLRFFLPSQALAAQDGMFSYNINVANAVASIFAATGQDLACIHESSVAFLHLEKHEQGLYLSLKMPCLVVGTVGGGTALPKQNEVLKLMNCAGKGKVERFAQSIAAFALALEISTYSAIVSGEFAKAHEKLGRNKPIAWLTRNELNEALINQILKQYHPEIVPAVVRFQEEETDNGILTNLAARTNNKLLGFFPLHAQTENKKFFLMLKSTATDNEVTKGLHTFEASIDTELSDVLYRYRNATEYADCHLKESVLYENLHQNNFDCTPGYFGKYEDVNREIYLLLIEFLKDSEMKLFNSENTPEKWTHQDILNVIKSITEVHQFYEKNTVSEQLFPLFEPKKGKELYTKLISILIREEDNENRKKQFFQLNNFLSEITENKERSFLPLTIIHNDFNPRNVAIRTNGKPCIYDWELAVKNIPHRDIVEFLAFTFAEINEKNLLFYLNYHATLWDKNLNENHWLYGYEYAIKELLVCRLSFYKVSEILMKLKFPDRVIKNCFEMLGILKKVRAKQK